MATPAQDTQTQTTPQPAAPPETVSELTDLLRERGLPIAVGIFIALAVSGGVILWRGHREAARQDAQLLYTSARTLDDLERVVTDYPKSGAAPLAVLRLGQIYYDNGNYVLADQQYTRFLNQFADHELAPAAELGRIHVMEAQGQKAEALEGYRAFVAAHPEHFLLPEATLGMGRCLAALNRRDEARIVFEQFIAENPDSAWVGRADEALDLLKRGILEPAPEAGDAVPGMAAGSPLTAINFDGDTSVALPDTEEAVENGTSAGNLPASDEAAENGEAAAASPASKPEQPATSAPETDSQP